MMTAVAGGVASMLGGGKFSNGARSAAMVHLFNAEGDILKLKLRLGLHAGLKGNIGSVGKGEIGLDAASADIEWTYGKDGWRFERKGGHQGATASVKAGPVEGELTVERTHPPGTNKFGDWDTTIDGSYKSVPLDGVFELQGGAIISPGIEVDFTEIKNWWNR